MTSYSRAALRYLVRLSLAGVAAAILVGLAAPFINASAFAGRVQEALAASLGRKVSFEEVHFNLFSGPGFSLTGVTIEEDPRYGLEPFAYVPKLQARVRLHTLLSGRLSFSSLRLDNPSLNLVNAANGTWNIVELISRLTAPSRLPINLFPAFAVSGGRLDFKFGTRKTVLYLADTDLNLYPQRSGKLYVQFSGSPARTDRSGTGLGHIRGTANWYLQPGNVDANQLEMDVILDPSNLSELATLLEGQDAGLHGTVSSHAKVEGPLAALRVSGNLKLADLHRWDLLPLARDEWHADYEGLMNVREHTLSLHTGVAAGAHNNPVTFAVRVRDYAVNPRWATLATLDNAAAADLVPLARRMGVPLPPDLKLTGSVDGAVGYAAESGFSGSLTMKEITAELPTLQPLHSPKLLATILRRGVRVEPSLIDAGAGTDGNSPGTLHVQGSYDLDTKRQTLGLQATDFPIDTLREAVAPWFGAPAALDSYRGGIVSGQVGLEYADGSDSPLWNGNLRFEKSEITVPALAGSLTDAQGILHLDRGRFDIDHFSASMGTRTIEGSYRGILGAAGTETAHIALPSADWADLESALDPTLRAQGLLARLGVVKREVPSWLAKRHLEAQLDIQNFSIDGTTLGALHTRMVVDGPKVQVPAFEIQLADGSLNAAGALNLASSTPHYEFTADVNRYRWRGGTLNARGTFRTAGSGGQAVENLKAAGTFTCDNVSFSTDDWFHKAAGFFEFSFAQGWAALRIEHLQASDEEAWTGTAETDKEGRLIINLEHDGQQRRVISNLLDERPVGPPTLLPKPAF